MIERQGKRFVLYAGLLEEAHSRGLRSIETELLQVPQSENGDVAIVRAVVRMEDGKLDRIKKAGVETPPEVSDVNDGWTVEQYLDALDRITIPQDVLDRIAPTALPRSSIIISDEPMSSETNYPTEFVVVLNDQPQGGFANGLAGGPILAHPEA